MLHCTSNCSIPQFQWCDPSSPSLYHTVTRNSPTDIPLWKHCELMLLAPGSSSSSRVPVRTLLPSTIQASVSEVIDAVMCLYLGQLLVAWKRKKKTTSLIPSSLTKVLASPPTIEGKLTHVSGTITRTAPMISSSSVRNIIWHEGMRETPDSRIPSLLWLDQSSWVREID